MTQYRKTISILSSLIFVSLFVFQITGCDFPDPPEPCGCIPPIPVLPSAEFMLVKTCTNEVSNTQDADEQDPSEVTSTCVYERTYELTDELKEYSSFEFTLVNKSAGIRHHELDLLDVTLDAENKKFTINDSVQLDDFEYIHVQALRRQAQDSNQDQADQE